MRKKWMLLCLVAVSFFSAAAQKAVVKLPVDTTNAFGSDYFKSSSKKKEKKEQKAQKESTTRRTTTSSGVTIIDDRDTEGKRKIFDHSDGEYVEFEEV